MARTYSLNAQQIKEIIRHKSDGKTYAELQKMYGVGKNTLIKAVKSHPDEIVKVASEVIQDQMLNADNYTTIVKEKMNEYLENNVEQMNLETKNKQDLISRHELAIRAAEKLYDYFFKLIETNGLSMDLYERCLAAQTQLVNNLAVLSKLYGMGVSQNQLNLQLNNQNNQFNTGGSKKKFEDDEFNGTETVKLIFCNSKEQAEILKKERDGE